MGGIILGKSTSDQSEKLDLAIYALSEVATKKIKTDIILLEDDISMFCESILLRDEDAQIKLINNLCNVFNSTNLLVEESRSDPWQYVEKGSSIFCRCFICCR